jgi:hypothetical protein
MWKVSFSKNGKTEIRHGLVHTTYEKVEAEFFVIKDGTHDKITYG